MNEFTVILYAGGTNRLSSDLSTPKALLPIGNRPLIWYSIQLIQSDATLSSSPLIILTSSSSRQSLDEYLSTLNLKYEIVLYRPTHNSTGDDQQINSDDLGTLDILRSCYSKIRTESICLLTADLFGKMSLSSMINSFRIRDASLMMLLIPTSSTTREAINQPGQKIKYLQEREFYSIDPTKEIVTSIRHKVDLEEHLPIKRNILIKYPRTRIRSDLVDAHLYLIKKCSLDIAIRSDYSSFRKEFLPKMIRQFAIGKNLDDLICSTTTQQKYLPRQTTTDYDDYTNLSKVVDDYQNGCEEIRQGCFYTIADQQSLFRVKHVIAFLEANRQAANLVSSYTNEDINFKDRLEQIQISADCIVADGSEFGKKTIVKRSIIGRNCRIEEKCKIINCVLLDNVVVKEGTTIQNSILCSRSIIGQKCDIQNSIVCATQQVEPEKKLSSETVSTHNDDGETFDLYDDNEDDDDDDDDN